MITKEISASVRSSFGKGPMRQLRVKGKTPGIVYGGGADALPLEFDTITLFQELLDIQGRNAVITLNIDDGTKRSVLVKEIQTDPVKDSLYHADFLEINVDKPVRFSVPITYTGKAKGVDLGGILEIQKKSVLLEGKPLDIPDACVIDISRLAIGDKITVAGIEVPAGVKMLSAADAVCVSVVAPA